MDKIFEKNACEKAHYGKILILIFQLLVLTKFLFWEEDWALGYNSMIF